MKINKILFSVGLLSFTLPAKTIAQKTPNIVIIFMDDMGRGDIQPYGAKIPTPNINRLAQQGMKFSDFNVASPICTPSRASLLTGCYPGRINLPKVLFPKDTIGLNENEMTIAELLKQKNYHTACVGKWHLGHLEKALPLNHGFDEYFGLPYSNDMKPLKMCENNTPLYDVEDQSQITTRYTEKCVEIINQHKDKPFFIYLAHSMPHVPLAVSDKFKGKSPEGMYGDVVMEIDWSVGEILNALEKNKLSGNTIVIFTSDNGPWLIYGDHAGKTPPFREGKFTHFEGGYRSFCLISWPKQIKKGSHCDTFCSSIDILPTIAEITDAPLSANKIDGRSFYSLLKNPKETTSPHDYFFYTVNTKVRAVRDSEWKLVLPHTYSTITVPGKDGKIGKSEKRDIELSLFNLRSDPAESVNLADQHPDIVQRLMEKALSFETELTKEARTCGHYK